MEHRLGTRMPTSVPVRLLRARTVLAFGSMLNASLSGAYIETSAPLPPLARVDVACGPVSPDRARCPGVPAYVTRVAASGLAVEWFEFAPSMIRQLLLPGESEESPATKSSAAGRRLDGRQGASRSVCAQSHAQ